MRAETRQLREANLELDLAVSHPPLGLVVYQVCGHEREHDPQFGAVIEQHD